MTPGDFAPPITALLARPATMDLGRGELDQPAVEILRTTDLSTLFAPHAVRDEFAARACLAGLHLYFDDLDGSHRSSQELPTPEGSFWHGIMHRREGDFWNAKYWFRRVGRHPAFAEIVRLVAERRIDGTAAGEWDPFAFVDRVEECSTGRSGAEQACRETQRAEWDALFRHCYDAAVNASSKSR
jgi:hypothetical protein